MNLDLKCAKAAEEIASSQGADPKKLEKVCQNGTAILAQHGPYAFFLYLHSESQEAKTFAIRCRRLLEEVFSVQGGGRTPKEQSLSTVKVLAEDLSKLLLARKLLAQVIMYTRYHVKAEKRETAQAGAAG